MRATTGISLVIALTGSLGLAACAVDGEKGASKSDFAGGGKADGDDPCLEYGWYDDGVCDDFCPLPDPDCGPVEPPAPTDEFFTCDELGGTCGDAGGACPEGTMDFQFDGETGCAETQPCCVTDTRPYSYCEGMGGQWQPAGSPQFFGRAHVIGSRVLVSWAENNTSDSTFRAVYEVTSDVAGTSYLPGTQFIKGAWLRGELPYGTPETTATIDYRIPNTFYYDSTSADVTFLKDMYSNSIGGHVFMNCVKNSDL